MGINKYDENEGINLALAKYAENGPGPLTYHNFNYCIRCRLRVQKERLYCPECNYRVRGRPRGAKARHRMQVELGIVRY